MKNIIVGTAGHIDHGKTALVKALTGIDADRLLEEKKRGITIDLGFAHLQLTPDIRLGFVDVPGHERFVKNMLAGAGGVDLLLFVISAEESIKPQTREHFDICRMLHVQGGIVVLTKSDLVPSDLVDLVRLEAEELVAGSFLQDAPTIPVSAVTGEGLDALRIALKLAAERIEAKDVSGPVRLPIDRSFSMHGFGTIVTGTLVSGVIDREQELELLPSGRVLRVRGLEAYGKSVAHASAGMRTAVNLVGIEPREIRRGMTLAERGQFEPTQRIDCEIELLPSARPMKNLAPVHFHAGTAELEAQVRFFRQKELAPGGTTFARLILSDGVVLAPGDRFILRQFSPMITIAGGTVVDVHPPREKKALRIRKRLEVLAGADDSFKAALLLDEAEGGLSLAQLGQKLGVRLEQALALARKANAVVLERPGWAVSRDWVQQRRGDVVDAVKRYHTANPLSPGVPKQELKASMPGAENFLLDAVLSGVAELAVEGDRVRHRTYRVALNSGEEQARMKIEAIFASAGLSVPSISEVLTVAGIDSVRGRTILRMLLKDRLLIQINDDLVFHHSAIAALKTLLSHRRNQVFTVSLFKEWTGISRKYAVPLLEFLDREHVTLRKGDSRVIA